MKNLIWFLFAGTRGGNMRARIIDSLNRKPKNAHQLAKELKVDYKTVQHHLKTLSKNKLLVVENKEQYGAVYFISQLMKEQMQTFNDIWERFGKN